MSTPNKNGTPSKRSRLNDESGSQTPNRDPVTPSRRPRAPSQQTPSSQQLRTPNRNRKYINFSNAVNLNFFTNIEIVVVALNHL